MASFWSGQRSRWSLEGKTAVVTGGTKVGDHGSENSSSSLLARQQGIGKAIVEELACLGAKVLTCSRTEADVASCIAEWKEKGLDVHGIAVDVCTAEGRQTLLQATDERFGSALDILVNNVGRSIRKDSTFAYTNDEVATIIDVNLNSVLSLTQMFHPLLKTAAAAEGPRRKGGSSVVNVSSIASVTAVKTGAAYAACKAAINRLTINWGCEWAKDGIRVNAVAPGATNTPSTASVSRSEDLNDRIPMGRWADPDEISGQVAFFCMEGASYITSQVVCIDGGWSSNGWM
ncbi:unnamed protein product [Scytosiphon promiscuus]